MAEVDLSGSIFKFPGRSNNNRIGYIEVYVKLVLTPRYSRMGVWGLSYPTFRYNSLLEGFSFKIEHL